MTNEEKINEKSMKNKYDSHTKEVKCSEENVNEEAVRHQYKNLTQLLIERNITVTTMESCTSGQIASLITDTEGSSAIFKGAFITYSNEAKIKNGVPSEIIENYGVYSSETASAMAEVCRYSYDADIGIGVTGSFGNTDPDNSDSIPCEIFFAIATRKNLKSCHCIVPVQNSRFEYKLYMAGIIADEIKKILSENLEI